MVRFHAAASVVFLCWMLSLGGYGTGPVMGVQLVKRRVALVVCTGRDFELRLVNY